MNNNVSKLESLGFHSDRCVEKKRFPVRERRRGRTKEGSRSSVRVSLWFRSGLRLLLLLLDVDVGTLTHGVFGSGR